jgi:hypothetical protein
MAKEYYVKSGNWCVKITLDTKDIKDTDAKYMEAATRAFEYIFGIKDFADNDCLIAIYNKNHVNVVNTVEELDAYTEATFTVFTEIYTNPNSPDIKKTLLSSNIFANASQYDNYKLAKQIEKEEGI